HKRISRFDLDSFSDWSLFFFMFSNRKHVFGMPCFLTKLSSYDYFLLFHQALHKNTQELSKILLRLFNLLQRNGRKSHRYEKKTVFDILGVVYEYTTSAHQVA
ncbi:hypothetical protein ACQVTQ_29430, partial [Bacillus mycoides]